MQIAAPEPRVDSRMVWPKAFYLCFYSAAAALLPFLVIYYQHQGLSGRQIGLLAGIPTLVMLVSAPLWGGLADLSGRHKVVLSVAIGGAVTWVLVLSRTTRFAWLIPVVGLYAFFAAPIMPLVDSAVMEMLGERKRQYGRLRLWGAVGWGISAPLIGELIERHGLGWPFWGYAILMLAGLYVSWQLPVRRMGRRGGFWSGARSLLANRGWVSFLVMAFLGGMGMAVISNFLFLYLDTLGASKTLMGLALTAATISEMPMYFFAERLLARWTPRGLLIFAMCVFVVRALAYSFMTAPWMALPVQLLHGPTFAAMWVAGVSYANEIAPAGMGATAQGLFSGVILGLGSASGALLGGILYDGAGAVWMFRWVGAGILLSLALFALLGRRGGRRTGAQTAVE